MKRRNLTLIVVVIILVVIIVGSLILNKGENKEQSKKQKEIERVEKKKEKAIKEMEKQVKILIEEQKNGQIKQEEMLKEYDVKIFKEIDKGKRIKLIKEMISIVGKYGIDASAIPTLDTIKNKLSDSDEKKIITDKIKMIMKNRDMFAELEEYEKYNQ